MQSLLCVVLLLAVFGSACQAQEIEGSLASEAALVEQARPASAFELWTTLKSGTVAEPCALFAPGHSLSLDVEPGVKSCADLVAFIGRHGLTATVSDAQLAFGSETSEAVLLRASVTLTATASSGLSWSGGYSYYLRAADGLVTDYRLIGSEPLAVVELFRPRTAAQALHLSNHYFVHRLPAAFMRLQRPDATFSYHGFEAVWPRLSGSYAMNTAAGLQQVLDALDGDVVTALDATVIAEADGQVFARVHCERRHPVTKNKDDACSFYTVINVDADGLISSGVVLADPRALPELPAAKDQRKADEKLAKKKEADEKAKNAAAAKPKKEKKPAQ